MRCRCCGVIGKWTIPARNGVGCVCKPCYVYINAPLCEEFDTKRLYAAVLGRLLLDFVYYRRFLLSGKVSSRYRVDIIKYGKEAIAFFGDFTGRFSTVCSYAEVSGWKLKKKIKNLTLKRINDILGELGK